jgi:hypothetical protein
MSKIKEENLKLKWELDHAKRNLINYITSVKQLEQVIESHLQNVGPNQVNV